MDEKSTLTVMGWGEPLDKDMGVDVIFKNGPIVSLLMGQAKELHDKLGSMIAAQSVAYKERDQ